MTDTKYLPPEHPAGRFVPGQELDAGGRAACIAELEETPARIEALVAYVGPARIDTVYRNWSIRQIVHHLADSHVNSYIRFKWTLTEEHPTIKAYDEGAWAGLSDSREGDLVAPLALLAGLHARWVQLLRSMTTEQFGRVYVHPETRETVPLTEALRYYSWHSRHHAAQIEWLREHHGW